MEKVRAFRTHLERLGYSKITVQILPDCLKEFLEQTAKPLQNITSVDILKHYEYLEERPNKKRSGGLSGSYINYHIYSLRLFFNYCLENDTLNECPISNLEFKAPSSKPREILTQEEVKELYQSCETLKEKATLSIFYGCGLRRTEGEKLDLKDVHFRSNLLYVREGKGKKRRAVPLSEKVKEDLKEYVYQERNPKAGETALIINQRGQRTSGKSYNAILKTLLDRSQIDKEITLHNLRHSIATHLLESGLPVDNVRDFLGHKHLESTQIYTRVNKQQLWNLNST